MVVEATRLCFKKAGESLGIVKDTDGQYLSIGVPKRTENVDESENSYISSLKLTNMAQSEEEGVDEEKINLNIE